MKNKRETNEGASVITNTWVCTTCKSLYPCLEVHPGETPDKIECLNSDCKGSARSLKYLPTASDRNEEIVTNAKYEFYRPEEIKEPKEYVSLSSGSLKMRKRTSGRPVTYNLYRAWLKIVEERQANTLVEQFNAEAEAVNANKTKKLYF